LYKDYEVVYDVVWAVVCLFIPLLILVVCNVCLVRAIRQSRQLQRLCRANFRLATTTTTTQCRGDGQDVSDDTVNSAGQRQRMTPTLVALIVVFIVCVSPSALLFTLKLTGIGDPTSGSKTAYHVYQTTTVVANSLFLVNFAANFVLYCIINVRFRCTARDVLCCVCSSPEQQRDRRSTANRH